MYQKQIEDFIEKNKESMLNDVCRLIRIPSDRKEPYGDFPFGQGPGKCLEEALEIATSMGFKTRNYENYVGAIDFNDYEKQLDILAHLDVVPVGDNWTVTKPFEPKVVNGRIYGRGAADDKGPAIAALYAMLAVKKLNIPLKKNVRLILGTDEECGGEDIDYYYNIEQEAPMTFSPDADYPVINIEKGGLRGSFKAEFIEDEHLPRICSIKGGFKTNVVADTAVAQIEGFTEDDVVKILQFVEVKTQVKFKISMQDNVMTIEAKGFAAHASTPEKGKNAITALLEALSQMPFYPSEGFKALVGLHEVFPHNDYHGDAAGIHLLDELSGELTISFNLFDYSLNGFAGTTDCRAPICATNENLRDVLRDCLKEKGIILGNNSVYPAHHVKEDTPFIQTLLSSYEKYSKKPGKCLAIGGGTYVHGLKNGVAFGCANPLVDNHMHGADEFIDIDNLLMSAKIFADAIINLCS